MSSPTIPPRYGSVEAAANYCSVSRTTIYKLIRAGEIRSSNIGARRVVDFHSIDDLFDRKQERPSGPLPPD